ncbi:MAG TPA: hypothetical protein VK988_15335, partial [Acidimicrobiales bacterium]|nr:hypothetical protein [Acidimicrobiales bacterium]
MGRSGRRRGQGRNGDWRTGGGLIYQPSFSIGGWMQEFLGKQPTGGEELPADALATVLDGV